MNLERGRTPTHSFECTQISWLSLPCSLANRHQPEIKRTRITSGRRPDIDKEIRTCIQMFWILIHHLSAWGPCDVSFFLHSFFLFLFGFSCLNPRKELFADAKSIRSICEMWYVRLSILLDIYLYLTVWRLFSISAFPFYFIFFRNNSNVCVCLYNFSILRVSTQSVCF